MAKLLMFAAIREAAGTREAEVDGNSVAEVLAAATTKFGENFERVLPHCMVLLNDTNDYEPNAHVAADATVALLPPVSGGAI